MTQLENARKGTITPEMEFVARSEGLAPEVIRDEVARSIAIDSLALIKALQKIYDAGPLAEELLKGKRE
jgi:thiamine biosynthesis protein ThiC